MKNIAIMVDGDTATIYSLRVNKDKLFDMLKFITLYGVVYLILKKQNQMNLLKRD